jgi:hypothetical protein
MKNLILTFLLFTVLISACEVYPQDDYEEYYVVEAYLVANRNLPKVRLSTTGSAFRFYSFENTAVRNADVQVSLLDEDGSAIEQVFNYSMVSPGIYLPDDAHDVLPERSYELRVNVAGADEEITSRTFVPGDFSIISGIQDSIVYQSSEQLAVTISESNYPGRQNIFVFNTLAQEPEAENLTPLYFDFYDSEDDTATQSDLLFEFSNNSSGLINEANFEVNNDGSITINYPWLAIAFYGENQIVTSTVDDNLYDFMRSAEVQLGGSTLSPGEIQNVITNVEGGIGIFGSLASDTITTNVKRNPQF